MIKVRGLRPTVGLVMAAIVLLAAANASKGAVMPASVEISKRIPTVGVHRQPCRKRFCRNSDCWFHC